MPRRTRLTLTLVAALVAAAIWVPGTAWVRERAVDALVDAAAAAGYRIEHGGSTGNLWRGVALNDVVVTGAGIDVEARRLAVDWFAPALVVGELPLRIEVLDAHGDVRWTDLAAPPAGGGATPVVRPRVDAIRIDGGSLRLSDIPFTLPDVALERVDATTLPDGRFRLEFALRTPDGERRRGGRRRLGLVRRRASASIAPTPPSRGRGGTGSKRGRSWATCAGRRRVRTAASRSRTRRCGPSGPTRSTSAARWSGVAIGSRRRSSAARSGGGSAPPGSSTWPRPRGPWSATSMPTWWRPARVLTAYLGAPSLPAADRGRVAGEVTFHGWTDVWVDGVLAVDGAWLGAAPPPPGARAGVRTRSRPRPRRLRNVGRGAVRPARRAGRHGPRLDGGGGPRRGVGRPGRGRVRDVRDRGGTARRTRGGARRGRRLAGRGGRGGRRRGPAGLRDRVAPGHPLRGRDRRTDPLVGGGARGRARLAAGPERVDRRARRVADARRPPGPADGARGRRRCGRGRAGRRRPVRRRPRPPRRRRPGVGRRRLAACRAGWGRWRWGARSARSRRPSSSRWRSRDPSQGSVGPARATWRPGALEADGVATVAATAIAALGPERPLVASAGSVPWRLRYDDAGWALDVDEGRWTAALRSTRRGASTSWTVGCGSAAWRPPSTWRATPRAAPERWRSPAGRSSRTRRGARAVSADVRTRGESLRVAVDADGAATAVGGVDLAIWSDLGGGGADRGDRGRSTGAGRRAPKRRRGASTSRSRRRSPRSCASTRTGASSPGR